MASARSASLLEERRLPDAPRRAMPEAVPEFIEEPGFAEYRDILLNRKRLILGTIALALACSTMYAIFATPIYRANLLLQIEDSAPDSKSFLTDTTGLGEIKTSANGEIQVIGSRMILGPAVDQVRLHLDARPRYLPLVGQWLARRATELSEPGFFNGTGYVTGTERIGVNRFAIPASFEDTTAFVVTARGDGRFTVEHELLTTPLTGEVGVPLRQATGDGTFEILLDELSGRPGAEFQVTVASRLRTIERLQERLLMSEQGRQSNVVNVALEDGDRVRLADTLNAIADAYVRQNVERKSAEAEKTLAFLNAQLPVFERQLRASEDAFARFRNQHGTIAFDEEAKVWLKSTADLQTSLLELQQTRLELTRTHGDEHPRVQTLDRQIAAVRTQLAALNRRIAATPDIQRDALRLERDMRANSAQYQSMQNNALQMRLLSEGKIGNVRLLDRAVVSKLPVKPQKALLIAFALVVGALAGPLVAIFLARTRRGIRSGDEIASRTGLEVFGAIPYSVEQARLHERRRRNRSFELLADSNPGDDVVKALRGTRIALKLGLANAPDNRILFTGTSVDVGTSFVASNFAALLAQAGKRVLLIDADLGSGGETWGLGTADVGGLCEVFEERLSIDDVIQREIRPNLDVLAPGRLSNPTTDFFELAFFAQLVDTLSARYDHVVIDGPPLLAASDALAMAPACGCVLIVARHGVTALREFDDGMRRLLQVGVSPHGVVLNAVRPD